MENTLETVEAMTAEINSNQTITGCGVTATVLTTEKGSEVRIGLHQIRIGQIRWYDGWVAEVRGPLSRAVTLREPIIADAETHLIPAMIATATKELLACAVGKSIMLKMLIDASKAMADESSQVEIAQA